MTRSEKILCTVYAMVSIVALYATWSNNIAFSAQGHAGGPLAFVHALYVNHAAASIANDLILVALSACVFMGMEGRRLKIRFLWAYIVFSVLIAIAVVFPLFLIARQIKLSQATSLRTS